MDEFEAVTRVDLTGANGGAKHSKAKCIEFGRFGAGLRPVGRGSKIGPARFAGTEGSVFAKKIFVLGAYANCLRESESLRRVDSHGMVRSTLKLNASISDSKIGGLRSMLAEDQN